MAKILDWKKYEECARQTISEGCVLLENKNNVLPLKKGECISIFGRIQTSYYKSGTGSGGMVNVSKVYNIIDGLESSGHVTVNKELLKIYQDWEKENPFNPGLGWGQEPWSQKEMPLTLEIVQAAAKKSQTAIVIIGRTAGEDKDNSPQPGSYLLSELEKDMLSKVRENFKNMVVLLNVGNIIDMSFVQQFQPDALMYIWHGGMLGGLGTADLLTGKVSPSGKLPDTIAKKITDYPSDKNFGNPDCNVYQEDIFVGYRYFETFAKENVLYPFGYGLSYTNFEFTAKSAKNDFDKKEVYAEIEVKNTGNFSGKETIQLYMQAPDGKLGKACRILTAFDKTENLAPGKSQILKFTVPYITFASYDDDGKSGNKSAWVLEAGTYKLYAGTDVRTAKEILNFNLSNTLLLKQCHQALTPREHFQRFHNENGKLTMEDSPFTKQNMEEERLANLPPELKPCDNKVHKLMEVYQGKISVQDFAAQLSDFDLSCLIRGEGMGSSLVTAGTASAFGGVSTALRQDFGIPPVCCDDGPSGMRIDSGVKAFSLPNGTCLASTFNCKLVKELYCFTGLEMCSKNIDNLLGPGMNIHRHPLNGRNFEYFSEDPLLTGLMASSMIGGLQSSGVTGTVKHFAVNNQEANRRLVNAVVSERALREIYLKGFEIAVENGADSIMTSYNYINGTYAAGNYELTTKILREDWGFTDFVMTDWWANLSPKDLSKDYKDYAAMIKAQNDIYMCTSNACENVNGANTLDALKNGSLTRGELQRSAVNILNQILKSHAMKILAGQAEKVEIINQEKSSDDVDFEDIKFTELKKDQTLTLDLSGQECKAETNYTMALDVEEPGFYEVKLTGSSELNELAQIPLTLFYQGTPAAAFTFNGTNGKDVTLVKDIILPDRFCVNRLYVASNGLKLKEISFKFKKSFKKF